MDSHEKYLELCAASTAGGLTGEETTDLQKHLAVCAPCRQAKREFELAIREAVPALVNDFASHSAESDANWSIERAEETFFKRLKADQSTPLSAANRVRKAETWPTGHRLAYRPFRIPWVEL